MRFGNYYVKWVYDQEPNPIPNGEPKRITICYIMRTPQNEDQRAIVVASGKTTKYHKDRFQKEVARRKSLEYALKTAFPGDGENKFIRREAWEQYRLLSPEPKW